MPRIVRVRAEVAQEVINYLATRPYHDVAGFMQELLSVRVEEEPPPAESPKEPEE